MHNKVSSDWLPSYIKARDRFSRLSAWLNTFRTTLVFLECPMFIPSVSGCGYWYNQTDFSLLLISNDEWHSGLSACPDNSWGPGNCLQVWQKEKLEERIVGKRLVFGNDSKTFHSLTMAVRHTATSKIKINSKNINNNHNYPYLFAFHFSYDWINFFH
jgi:hypothetical protein